MATIHFNPVKARAGRTATGSGIFVFRRCVAAGLYPAEWDRLGGDTMKGGERR